MTRDEGAVTEFRRVGPAELGDYVRILPYAAGLPHWEPYEAAWYGGSEAWPPPNPRASTDTLAAWASELAEADGFHPQAAFVDGRVVGASAMLDFEITVPGLRQVPMGGVTSTAVVATHRRRGLLRGIMQAMFDEARDRGQPLAGLSASEGSIYGRFGFGPATRRTRWEIDRHQAAFSEPVVAAGSLELVDADEAQAAFRTVHDVVRRTSVGELSKRLDQWPGLTDDSRGNNGSRHFLVHRDSAGAADGVATYRLPWSPHVEGAGTLVVETFTAASMQAYRAMWGLLLDFDLTRKVVAAPRPSDEPLRWMLQNPRAPRVTRQSDSLWIRLLDLSAALAARTYDSPGSLVLEIEEDRMCPENVGRWRLDGDATGAVCTPTTETPDLVVDVQTLGSLYLGGGSAALFARSGRLRGGDDAVRLMSRMFRTDPEPFNSFVF